MFENRAFEATIFYFKQIPKKKKKLSNYKKNDIIHIFRLRNINAAIVFETITNNSSNINKKEFTTSIR